MPSNAGLNRVGSFGGKIIVDSKTGDGPFDSGAVMLEAKGFTNWVFTLEGTFTNYSVDLYGTIDQNTTGYTDATGYHEPTESNWFKLPAPSTESTGDANQWKNPLAAVGDALYVKCPLIGVRAVVTGTASTGTISVRCFALE